MPDMPNLLDIVKFNEGDALAGLIDESIRVHPEVAKLPSRPVPGINYTTLVRKALGRTTGSFRAANAGTTPVKGLYELKQIECFIMSPFWLADVAVAKAYVDGPEAYMAIEANGILEGEMQGLSNQFYYGTDATFGNTMGFPGLLQAYDTVTTAGGHCYDAGGTTESTCSSVWLVRAGIRDVIWCWGNGGRLAMDPPQILPCVDPNDSTKYFDAYRQSMLARPGLQVGSQRSVVRIKKLTKDTGKGLTDNVIAAALAMFPAGYGPTHCFMTLRSLMQLQQSRTAVNPQGFPAEIPLSLQGADGQRIEICVTDAIKNTETLAL